MSNQVLVLTESDICSKKGNIEYCARHKTIICKATNLEGAVGELKSGRYLLVVVSLNRRNAKLVNNHIKVLRSLTATPIVAVAEEPLEVSEKIAVLTNGADQFIEPPLATEEAIKSIAALIRLFIEPDIPDSSTVAYYDHGIIISPRHRMVFIGGKEVGLLKKEFDILSLLAINHGIVLSYERIFANVWGEDYISNSKNTLWNQIRSLRGKIQTSPYLPKFIKTVHGIGYSFDPRYNTS